MSIRTPVAPATLAALPTSATLAALALASLVSVAAAQDVAPEELSVSELDDAAEIVVTATRTGREAADVPFSTSRVDRRGLDGLETRLRRTVTDGMVDLPSVMVQKTAYGQASPFIRGFTGYRTVMLVDGIRLNNSTFRSGPNQYWATVDPFTVERIELVRGAGSVLYGSDAVGGVANAVARRRSSFEEGTHVGYRSLVRYAGAEDSWTVRGEAEGNVDDLGFLFGGTYRTYDDFEWTVLCVRGTWS
jgi:hemoglobin/transferrin/lactoferrin receptor protein